MSAVMWVVVLAVSATPADAPTQAAIEAVFGGTQIDLSKARALAPAARTYIERRRAEILVDQLEHAQQLIADAQTFRTAGDIDRAIAHEARFIMMGRRFLDNNVGPVVRQRVPIVRAGYVDLAEKLLVSGRGRSARKALDIAARIDPKAPGVERLDLRLAQTARAAFLKGYGIYRDSGVDQLRVARKLWRFAVDTSREGSLTRQKASALLQETSH